MEETQSGKESQVEGSGDDKPLLEMEYIMPYREFFERGPIPLFLAPLILSISGLLINSLNKYVALIVGFTGIFIGFLTLSMLCMSALENYMDKPYYRVNLYRWYSLVLVWVLFNITVLLFTTELSMSEVNYAWSKFISL